VTSTPKPNSNFRPDPDRGIYLSGPITQEALDRLTPAILKLQASCSKPLTIYIDSPGGETRIADAISNLLRASGQDSPFRCRLLTVVTSTAASAAADLLASGDYALAYPHSRILCHGVRQGADALTREQAILLARGLASSNEGFALELARNCIFRFIFRFVFLSKEFGKIRERENDASLSQAACMAFALEERISGDLRTLLWDSYNKSVEIEKRDEYVTNKITKQQVDYGMLHQAEFSVLILKAILDYELKLQEEKNFPPWNLGVAFGEIEEKFLLLIDKHDEHHNAMIRSACNLWGGFFLTPAEEAELERKAENEREEWIFSVVQGRLRPIWSFFVSLCRQLQKEDHWLSAEDAYWLGLIDEVIGRNDLSNLRLLTENAPTPLESSPASTSPPDPE
jgi:ATP-dependent protease ClpP protease subunit